MRRPHVQEQQLEQEPEQEPKLGLELEQLPSEPCQQQQEEAQRRLQRELQRPLLRLEEEPPRIVCACVSVWQRVCACLGCTTCTAPCCSRRIGWWPEPLRTARRAQRRWKLQRRRQEEQAWLLELVWAWPLPLPLPPLEVLLLARLSVFAGVLVA